MELEELIKNFEESLRENGFKGFKLKITLIENDIIRQEEFTPIYFEYTNTDTCIPLSHMRISPYGDCYNYRAVI